MSDQRSIPSRAIFLSYASQDSEGAKRICEALRRSGLEVWFDQSELRGGDVWDLSIRTQIKECALFIPIISAHTQARAEGYFRLEWRLADQRTHLMGRLKPFLVPVCIDDTRDSDADVPDSFAAVQWTRLPGGDTPLAFVERVKNLLNGPGEDAGRRSLLAEGPSLPYPAKASRWWAVLAIPAVLGLALVIWRPWRIRGESAPGASGAVPLAAAPLSEAQVLVQRGRSVWESGDEPNRETILAAREFYARALNLDSTDPEAWAAAGRLDAMIIYMNYDTSSERIQKASSEAARAISLAPNSFAARRAQACVFGLASQAPEMMAESERIFRSLVLERPGDKSLKTEFGIVLRDEGNFDEAESIFEKAGPERELGWAYFLDNKYKEADAVADRILAGGHSRSALLIKAHTEFLGLEDIEAAYATTKQFTPVELQSEDVAVISVMVALDARKPDTAIHILQAYPRDFLKGGAWGALPARYWKGFAQELEGDPDAAHAQWQIALQQVQVQLAADPDNLTNIFQEALLFASLGRAEDARHSLKLIRDLTGAPFGDAFLPLVVKTRLGDKEEVVKIFAAKIMGKAVKARFSWHANLRFDPWFDAIRSDPRIEKLLRATLPPGAKSFDEATVAATSSRGPSG